MNKEDPYRDQAERLRKKIDRKQEAEYSGQKSALPPRSRVHQEKRKKSKWKVKYPVIRLLALFFILLPITIFSIYQYVSSDKSINAGLNAENEEIGSETVVFATNDEGEGTTIEVREEPESQEPEKPEKAEGVQVKEDAKVQQEKEASQTTDKEDKGSESNSQKQAQQTAPESTDSSKTAGKQEQEELKTEGKVVYHTVKPKETIFRIAMTYYKSQSGIEKIKQANNLPSNEIQTGQVLKIPLEQ
ncbi:LysM peptidoglycan-binding domain-containing protein [Cytobacillus firmus]|uniref:LysM peptidoglycan-binding domain-containing protein n=1 Tax=Cytobacillus TaxID=2675230 RepID=UPI00203DBAB7|nr:LysM peptidoglycan-binding domain-containing protein [Cytobacillus oceanisediminis]MCM3243635.1 LysM peptidoglycan-binding domain-containing protein [Cytobacillus oceanisediminis]MCS0826488.1 LysM peptidoglycan-binding domain-containing protein [Cytobacillus firmus]